MNDRDRVSVLEGLLARVRENAQQARTVASTLLEGSFVEPSSAEPSSAEPSSAEPSFAEPSFAEPSFAEPAQLSSSRTESVNDSSHRPAQTPDPSVSPEKPKLISFDAIALDDVDVDARDGVLSPPSFGAITQRSGEAQPPVPVVRPRLELTRGPSEPPPTKPILQLDDVALDEELVGSTPPPPFRESSEPAWAPPRFTRPPTLPPPPALVPQPPALVPPPPALVPPPPALVPQPPVLVSPPPALMPPPPALVPPPSASSSGPEEPPPPKVSIFDEVTMTGDPDEAEAMILREREAMLESEGSNVDATTQRPLRGDDVPVVSVAAHEPISLDDLDVELYSQPPPPAVEVGRVVPVEEFREEELGETESAAMRPDEVDEIEEAALRASLPPEEPLPESARKPAEARPFDDRIDGFDEPVADEDEPPPESGPVPSVPPEVRAGKSSDWAIHRSGPTGDFDDPLDESSEHALGVETDDAPTPRPFEHLGVSHAATPPDGTPMAHPYVHDDLGDATAEVRSLGRVDIVERAPVIERDSVAVFIGARDPETFGEVLDEALSF